MSREHPSDIRLLPLLYYFWQYNKRYSKAYYSYLLSNIIGTLSAGIALPLVIRSFINEIALGINTDTNALQSLHTLLLFAAVLYLVRILTTFLSDYFITQVGPKILEDIENDCFGIVHRLPLSFFASNPVGSIVAKVKRFAMGHDVLDIQITRGLLDTVLQLAGSIAIAFFFSWTLGLAFLFWGALYGWIGYISVQKKLELDVAAVKADSKTTGLLADTITNVLSIKIFSAFKREHTYFKMHTHISALARKQSWLATTAIDTIQIVIISLSSLLILFLMIRLWNEGTIDTGTIVLMQTFSFLIAGHLLQFGNQLKAIYRTAADCMEMMDIIRLPVIVKDPSHPEDSAITHGEIAFNSIHFAYGQQKEVLRNFSLHIPAGQKVGIVGKSGAGKSTIISLLLRFMDPQSGTITIDTQNISSITQENLRRYLGYIPQDTLLLHRSIKKNIAYGKEHATDEEIIDAAKKSHAHEFIESMPQGYETIVGERGMKLSGGERQRIAIARTMLENAPILILDEATSSLDSISERLIQEAFDALSKDKTTIVIAHRLSTLQKMDRIIVLEGGEIIEDGNHKELLKKSGVYAELWKHQSDGFLKE